MARLGRGFPARAHVGRVPPPAVNLLTCTDTLNDASWASTAVTVAKDGTAGPTGVANEAWLLKEDSTTNFHLEGQSPLLVPQGVNCTQSVYAKQGSGTRTLYVQINTYVGATYSATFDVSAGSVLQTVGGATATIQDVGGGWWRCSVLFPTNTGVSQFKVFLALRIAGLGATNYAGDGTSGIYLARPQLEVGSLSGYVAVPCGTSATIAVTDAADSAAIAVSNTAVVTLAITDAADSAAIAVANSAIATLAITDAGDSCAIAVNNSVTATIGVTDAADSCAAAVQNTAVATIGVTDAADSVAIVVSSPAVVTIAVTDAADSVAISAQTETTATIAATDAADSCSIAVQNEVTATLGITDAADACAIVVQNEVTATIAATDAADSADIEVANAVGATATIDVTDAADSVAIVVQNAVNVTIDVTDAADSVSIAVANTVTATIAVTDAADSCDIEASGQTAVVIDGQEPGDGCSITVLGTADISGGRVGPSPPRVTVLKPIVARVRTGQAAQTTKTLVTLRLVSSVKTRQPPQETEAVCEMSLDAVVQTTQTFNIRAFGWMRMRAAVTSKQARQASMSAANCSMVTKITSNLERAQTPIYEAPEWEMPIVFRDIA